MSKFILGEMIAIMSKLMYNTLIIGGIGFFTAWMGIISGILFSFFINKRDKRFKGTSFGFIGGLMIAIVCFDLIPASIEASNIYFASIGIAIGLIISVLLEGKLDFDHMPISTNENTRFLKSGIFMAIAIGIHHVPIGFALGSLLSADPIKGIHLAIAIIFHGIPEGLALGIFFNESKINIFTLILISILTSIPLGIGAIVGGIISEISPAVISLSLAFTSGMILYIICSETLPNARETWKGRLSTIGIIIGMIAGILIISFLE